jgi:ABC-type tungstate transport system substrate-binding protein
MINGMAYELGHYILLFGAGMAALWVAAKTTDRFGWTAGGVAGFSALIASLGVVVWLGG